MENVVEISQARWSEDEIAVATGQIFDEVNKHKQTLSIEEAIRETLAEIVCQRNLLREALKTMTALFDEGHAIDRFDWGKSFLRAQDIRELNEAPCEANRALEKCE